MKKYYITQNNEQKGPFSLEELKVSPTTLIWKEGMSDWIEAKNVKELEILFKSTPPPLPKKKDEKNITQDKTLNVNLRVKKENRSTKGVVDKITIQKRKTIIAKEIKLVGKIFLFSIIIGLISYPFFAYKGFKALHLKNKYVRVKYTYASGYYNRSNSEIDKMDYEVRNQITSLVSKSEEDYYYRLNFPTNWQYNWILDNYIRDMKRINIDYSVIVIIISFFAILLGRFMYKGVNWVSENSKK